MAISEVEARVLARLADRGRELEAFLKSLVDINSHTANIDGVNAVGAAVERHLLESGLRTSAFVTGKAGAHILGRTRTHAGNRLLLLGHLDTVYPESAKAAGYRTMSDDEAKALGPGVTDMKGGVTVMLAAVRALAEENLLDDKALTVLLSADEETGAPTSAELIAQEAADHHLCLVFETGADRGLGRSSIVVERKGMSQWVVDIAGHEAHAGAAKAEGVSAALEAARKIVALEALNDLERGISVNVGLVSAGTAVNTVPGSARLEIGCGFRNQDEEVEIIEVIEKMLATTETTDAAGVRRAAIRSEARGFHPAMTPTDASRRMADRIIAYGRDLGLELDLESRGGSSDGNITAHHGCPTVDGLGTVGGKIHSGEEWVLRRSLVDRASLLALTMMRFYDLQG